MANTIAAIRDACIPDLAIGTVLRGGRRQKVVEVVYRGQPGFLKIFAGREAAGRFSSSVDSHRIAADLLGAGRNRSVELLSVFPAHYAFVSAAASGTPMRQFLLASSRPERARLVHRSGEWLQALTRNREPIPLQAWKLCAWLDDLAAMPEYHRQVERGLLRRAMDQVVTLARALHGSTVEGSFSHGDFHPENLFVDRGTAGLVVTAIDLETPETIPVVGDIAKMLTWLEVDDDHGTSDEGGISGCYRWPMLAAMGVLPDSDRRALHFRIGVSLTQMYLTRGSRTPRNRRNIERALGAWLASDHLRLDG